jgi:hypothetical protein
MTLIALVNADEFPILFGDILISSTMAPAQTVDLPTIGKLPAELKIGAAHYVAGVQQKVCIFSGSFAVAWSGRSIYAHHALRIMQERFRDEHPTASSVKATLSGLDPSVYAELSLICLFRDGDRWSSIGMNVISIDTPIFGHCYVAGSGSGPFIEKLYSPSLPTLLEGTPHRAYDMLLSMLALAGDVLAEEMAWLPKFQFGYGGSIEIAVPDGERIVKIGDITCIFSLYDSSVPGRVITNGIILKIDYYDNQLIVRRLEQSNESEEVPGIVKNYKVYAIPCFGTASASIDINMHELPGLNGAFLLHHIFVLKSGKVVASIPSVNWCPDRSGPLREQHAKDRILIGLEQGYINQILEYVTQIADAID